MLIMGTIELVENLFRTVMIVRFGRDDAHSENNTEEKVGNDH